jgi:uncharacterized protein YwqG
LAKVKSRMSDIFPFISREEKMVDASIERNREPSLVIVPHGAGKEVKRASKFGGLPVLSSDTDWPRDPKGRALHFLAQIDCEELPWHGRLPNVGMLSFFGRDDEEQLWSDDTDDPTENCVVLYEHADPANRSIRHAPPDLTPIGGGLRRAADYEPIWENGKRIPHIGRIHTEREIRFHPKPIMTIPETIYHGRVPLADWNSGGWLPAFRAMLDGESNDAVRQLELEDRLLQVFDRRRSEFNQSVASSVFGKDASSHEAWGHYSQMLGHPNTSQGSFPPISDAICLLNIASDIEAGFCFGGFGFCTFWVSETDLAQRDFSRVYGKIEGA